MSSVRVRKILNASVAAASLALAAQHVFALDITQSATFVTTNQSLFGTGNATNLTFTAGANLLNLNVPNLGFGVDVGGADISLQGSATAMANVSLNALF